MTSLNGSFRGLIPKEPEILARQPMTGKSVASRMHLIQGAKRDGLYNKHMNWVCFVPPA